MDKVFNEIIEKLAAERESLSAQIAQLTERGSKIDALLNHVRQFLGVKVVTPPAATIEVVPAPSSELVLLALKDGPLAPAQIRAITHLSPGATAGAISRLAYLRKIKPHKLGWQVWGDDKQTAPETPQINSAGLTVKAALASVFNDGVPHHRLDIMRALKRPEGSINSGLNKLKGAGRIVGLGGGVYQAAPK